MDVAYVLFSQMFRRDCFHVSIVSTHNRRNDKQVVQPKFDFGLPPSNEYAACDQEEEEYDEGKAQADNVASIPWIGRVRRWSGLPVRMRWVREEFAASECLDSNSSQLVIWCHRRIAQQC